MRRVGLAHALIVGVSLVAALLALIASDPYPGATVDSGEYLAVAEGLTEGRGLTMSYVNYDEAFRVLRTGERVDMTQFPPLYPAALAFLHWSLGLSLLDGARVIGALGFGLLVGLVCELVWRETQRLWPVALGAALLLAPDLLTVHAMAWSEAIMLASVAAALYFARSYIEDHRRVWLVLAGVSGVIASMARFAGIAVLGAVAILVLVDRTRPRKERLLRAFGFLSLCLLPTVAWFVRNLVVAGYASEKTLRWHPPAVSHLGQAAQAVGSWLVPGKTIALVVGSTVLLVAVVYIVKQRPGVPEGGLPRFALLFAAIYLLFMLATKTLLDQNISLDGRILSPVHLSLILALCTGRWIADPPRWGVLALALLAAVSVGRGVHAAATFSSHPTASYTNERWRASETLAFAASLPPDALIITNAPDPIWLWQQRSPQVLPPRRNLYTGEPNAGFRDQIAELRQVAACRDGVVLFFEQPTRKPPREIPLELVDQMGLKRTHSFEDGGAYVLADPPACRDRGLAPAE